MKKIKFIIITSLLFVSSSFSQFDNAASVEIKAEPKQLLPRQPGTASLIITINPDYYIGGPDDGFFGAVPKPEPFIEFGTPVYPAPQETAYGQQYSGKIIVEIPFKIKSNAKAGEIDLQFTMTFQPCSKAGICFPPEDHVVQTAITVLEDGSEAGVVEFESPDMKDRLSDALQKGSFLAFILVFLGGILTSFTPCVYPMIPITIAVIGAQAEGSKLKGFILSLFYVLGLSVTFTALGVIAATTGALFGALAQHPAAVIFISLIFFLMGLSMLGVFTIQMPSSVQTKLQSKKKKGFLGAFLTGLIAGLVVSPCVSPLLVVILTYVAQAGSIVMGIGLLFSFALGLGILFILIGTFSGVIKNLPKSGGWMEIVERAFGVLLVSLALYFIKPLLAPNLYSFFWGAGLVVLSVFLGAFYPFSETVKSRQKWGKALGLIALIIGFSIIFQVISQGRSGIRGNSVQNISEQKTADFSAWHSSEAQGLEQARRLGKPVLIDFFAEWCAACHELDEKTWPHSDVARELEKYVLIRLDHTRNSPENRAEREKYNVIGLPTVILLSPDGAERTRFEGFMPPERASRLLSRYAEESI